MKKLTRWVPPCCWLNGLFVGFCAWCPWVLAEPVSWKYSAGAIVVMLVGYAMGVATGTFRDGR